MVAVAVGVVYDEAFAVSPVSIDPGSGDRCLTKKGPKVTHF